MPQLMLTMENVLSASHPSDIVSYSTPEIEVSSAVIQTNESTDGYVVVETIIGRVTMPVILVEDGRIRMTTIVYQNIQKRWTLQQGYRHAQIGSHVLSVSLQRLHNVTSERLNISQPKSITMVLPTQVNGREKERLCTFWNFDEGFWDTTGGRLLTKNDSHTECQFDHLTNFAVLVLYYDQSLSLSKLQKQTMFVLTIVCCSLSITCLGVCIILYIYLHLLGEEKILIHANLCIALMLAQLVLVTSHGAERVTAACKTVAVLLHYLFMSSFSWMMLEGLAVYLACTRGLYNYGDMRLKYFLVGWGLPAIIVTVSVGVQFPNYGETADDSCWLSVRDGLIWAFMGPMLVVVVFNLFILCLVIKVFLTLRANSRKTQAAKLRASVRAMVTLLPLLGVTWVLSILVPLHHVFHYLFIIGNAMQGIMIFLLHGIGNDEVRKGLSERRKRHSITGSESVTTINSSQPKILRFKQLLVPVETYDQGSDRRQAWTEL
ncbi:adhesion G-protein coupled receptor D1-like [Mizuhopecten yessoensis]|uniref:adhesion G-protein coupled receptor D1-like n=1 Tax=Mizuhopecten yessoensis TaxID=6573 RepID=UPI000B45D51B|nr:adhesion G-protein coupled receptor D1-like [Mizuhopecten yessoensis]